MGDASLSSTHTSPPGSSVTMAISHPLWPSMLSLSIALSLFLTLSHTLSLSPSLTHPLSSPWDISGEEKKKYERREGREEDITGEQGAKCSSLSWANEGPRNSIFLPPLPVIPLCLSIYAGPIPCLSATSLSPHPPLISSLLSRSPIFPHIAVSSTPIFPICILFSILFSSSLESTFTSCTPPPHTHHTLQLQIVKACQV